MDRKALLDGLNEKQREAVQCTEGPLLIMAGAGSGKTRVLTHRMAYLLYEKDVAPYHLLAITFTNKAAREMQERVVDLVGPEARQMWVSTFHSMAARILRREAEALGLSSQFTIAGTSEQKTLMKQVLKDLNLDRDKFKPNFMLSQISAAKNLLQSPDDYQKTHQGYIEDVVGQVYAKYQAELLQAQALDFDDLIMYTVRLFKEHPDILKAYQRRFHYIHVDEYQDTNEAQYALVKLLSAYFGNVCVVGDADQSIYGWRGANMENILNFEEDYPKAKVILLEQNYRSTQTILKAANGVIENNVNRKAKKLWTENPTGEKITYYRAQNERDEGRYVLSKIKEHHEAGRSYREMAILYRTNAQSRTLEEALVEATIPYRIVGGLKFYDRKEIKDVLAYLTLLVNPEDNLSFVRVINTPKRGVGPGTLEKLEKFANERGLALLEAAVLVEESNIRGKGKKSLLKFAQMLQKLQKERQKLSITELTKAILEQSGYRAALKAEHNLEAEARLENIDELLSVTAEFDQRYEAGESVEQLEAKLDEAFLAERDFTVEPVPLPEAQATTDSVPPTAQEQQHLLALTPQFETAEGASLADPLLNFLTELSLVSERNDEQVNGEGEVTLMTLHSAKGLEFPIVFLVGMEQGIFPLSRAMDEPDEHEEERRLAYVGITRAEEKLYLTNAYSRLLYGRPQSNMPSEFIEEIDDDLIKTEGRAGGLRAPYGETTYNREGYTTKGFYQRKHAEAKRSVFSAPYEGPAKTQSSPSANWQVGDKARHPAWGTGMVVQVKGEGQEQEVDIAFPKQGLKRLLTAFAPIEKI